MSGHSKWATIKRAKGATDAKRGKVFSTLGKEIMLAARSGGGSVDSNARLRTILLKAREANMPNENIERAIKKGTGEIEGVVIEQMTYEGYAPAGAGIILEVTTDNKNRAASEVRSVFTRYGGNLAQTGAVSFQFNHCGQFLIGKAKTTEDKLMELALDAGAEDVSTSDDGFEVICPVSVYYALSGVFEKAGIKPDSSEIVYLPKIPLVLNAADAARVQTLLDALEDLDDVQHVFSNHEVGE
ncbi:MAG: YebC/PmpR family DNA-binding transcriptional regulator [Opitutaceae bacterium]|nr:YebC/PmpR family DNA-binding transcriptional regulator [Opitutaceae bacterium]